MRQHRLLWHQLGVFWLQREASSPAPQWDGVHLLSAVTVVSNRHPPPHPGRHSKQARRRPHSQGRQSQHRVSQRLQRNEFPNKILPQTSNYRRLWETVKKKESDCFWFWDYKYTASRGLQGLETHFLGGFLGTGYKYLTLLQISRRRSLCVTKELSKLTFYPHHGN